MDGQRMSGQAQSDYNIVMNLALSCKQYSRFFPHGRRNEVIHLPEIQGCDGKNKPSGLSHGFVTFIGIAELTGAIGVVLPMAVNVSPWFSGWGALGLALIMLLAIGYHVRRRESPATVAVLFVLAAFVAYGRLAH